MSVYPSVHRQVTNFVTLDTSNEIPPPRQEIEIGIGSLVAPVVFAFFAP